MVAPVNKTSLSYFASILDDYPRGPCVKEKIERARKRLIDLEGGFSYLPGVTNLVLAPLWLASNSKETYSAYLDGDSIGARETGLRSSQDAIAFLGSAATLLDAENVLFQNIPYPFPDAISPPTIAKAGGILGIVLCFLELIFESLGLARQIYFRNSPLMHFADFLKKHKTAFEKEPLLFAKELRQELPRLIDQLTDEEKQQFEDLVGQLEQSSLKIWTETCTKELYQFSMATLTCKFAERYFPENDYGARRLSLERKVGIATCVGLNANLQNLSEQLSNRALCDEEAMGETREMFQILDDQALKKEIVHILGICAAILIGTALALAFFSGYGTAAVLTFFIVGTLFSVARYSFLHGIYNHKSWKFSFNRCLPTFLQKYRTCKINGPNCLTAISQRFYCNCRAKPQSLTRWFFHDNSSDASRAGQSGSN